MPYLNHKPPIYYRIISVLTAGIFFFSIFIEGASAFAPYTGTRNPALRCEYIVLSLINSGRLIFTKTPEDINFLEKNHARALLLSHGKILAHEDLKNKPEELLKIIIHEQVEAIMQIMAEEERSRYLGIIDMVFNGRLHDEFLVNHIIARAVELIIARDENLLTAGLSREEEFFLSWIEPRINRNRHNYFTGVFWDASLRDTRIRIAIANGMRFCQAANAPEDDLNKWRPPHNPREIDLLKRLMPVAQRREPVPSLPEDTNPTSAGRPPAPEDGFVTEFLGIAYEGGHIVIKGEEGRSSPTSNMLSLCSLLERSCIRLAGQGINMPRRYPLHFAVAYNLNADSAKRTLSDGQECIVFNKAAVDNFITDSQKGRENSDKVILQITEIIKKHITVTQLPQSSWGADVSTQAPWKAPRRGPPPGSIYSVFKYLWDNEITSPDKAVSWVETAVELGLEGDTVRRDFSAQFYHLYLLKRAEGRGRTARYYISGEVKKKLKNERIRQKLFAVLAQLRTEDLRPDRERLKEIYENEIRPILYPVRSMAPFTKDTFPGSSAGKILIKDANGLLTRNEERVVFRAYGQADADTRELIEWRLLEIYRGFISKKAKEFTLGGENVEGNIEEAARGFFRAVREHDPEEAKLTAHSAYWIREYIMNARESMAIESRSVIVNTRVIENAAGSGKSSAMCKDEKEEIRAMVDMLPAKEARVIKLRYGMGEEGGKALTSEGVGENLKVTGARIRQLEARALDKLRRRLRAASREPKPAARASKRSPPPGSIYSVFKYLWDNDITSPDKAVAWEKIAAGLREKSLAYDTIRSDLSDLFYHLRLIKRIEGKGRAARYYISDDADVKEKLENEETRRKLFAVLERFRDENLRPGRALLKRVYEIEIRPSAVSRNEPFSGSSAKTILSGNTDRFLTRDEERIVFGVYKTAGEGTRTWVRERLEERYRYFVRGEAFKWTWAEEVLENNIQYAWAGFFNAVEDYDPDKGALTTHSATWIRKCIIEARKDIEGSLIRLPRYLFERLAKIRKAIQHLKVSDAEPAIADISKATGFKEEEVRRLLKIGKRVFAIDNIDSMEDIPAGSDMPDDTMSGEEKERIRAVVDTLPARDAEVLKLRYGIGTENERPYKLREIGNKLHLTKARAQQIVAGAVRKLQERLTAASQEPEPAATPRPPPTGSLIDLPKGLSREWIDFINSLRALEEIDADEFRQAALELEKNMVKYGEGGQSLILYADDILENAAVTDFESTIRNIIVKHDVLKGGKIVLFARKAANAKILKNMIKRAGPAIETVTITQVQIEDRFQTNGDEIKETAALVRMARAKGAREIFGIIKGPTAMPEALTAFSDFSREQKIPVVLLGHEKGVYSFARALLAAINAKYFAAENGWVVMLPPIRAFTKDIRAQYEEYQRSLTALQDA